MFKPFKGTCVRCERDNRPIVVKAGYCDRCNYEIKQQKKAERGDRKPKPKEVSTKVLVPIYDSYFSLLRRKMEAEPDGKIQCATCGHYFRLNEIQCGHFITREEYGLRWSFVNTAPQCPGPDCNAHQNGNQEKFAEYIDSKHGKGTAERLKRERHLTFQISTTWLKEQIEKTKQELKKYQHVQ